MKIYISGPMTGFDKANEDVFRFYAAEVAQTGHEAVVPHDIAPHLHEGECPRAYTSGVDHSAACYLRGDVVALLRCDAILMIEGWESSVGARFEHSVAAHCGMPVFYEVEEILPDGISLLEALRKVHCPLYRYPHGGNHLGHPWRDATGRIFICPGRLG